MTFKKDAVIIKTVIITDFEDKTMKNYSRQREAILNVLRSSKGHPTADEVYRQVREEIPNISLGTVYRNLALLRKEGNILSVSVGDGSEHFDGDCSPHIHLHCSECGKIHDLTLERDVITELAAKSGFTPHGCVYVVYGKCADCN